MKPEVVGTHREWAARRREWRKKHPFRAWFKKCVHWPFLRFVRRIENIPREVCWFIQRGLRGWADCDTWSIDWYLNRIMPEMLERLAERKIGAPFGIGQPRWKNMLLRQAKNYRVMHRHLEDFRFKEATRILKEINRFMDKYYFSLWD